MKCQWPKSQALVWAGPWPGHRESPGSTSLPGGAPAHRGSPTRVRPSEAPNADPTPTADLPGGRRGPRGQHSERGSWGVAGRSTERGVTLCKEEPRPHRERPAKPHAAGGPPGSPAPVFACSPGHSPSLRLSLGLETGEGDWKCGHLLSLEGGLRWFPPSLAFCSPPPPAVLPGTTSQMNTWHRVPVTWL